MYKFPFHVVKLIKALESHDYEAYVVGGAVRDILLGKNPHDYDIATSATPEDAIGVAKEMGWQTIDKLGKNFGTIIIVVNGVGMEVTTFRGERYDRDSHRRFGRHGICRRIANAVTLPSTPWPWICGGFSMISTAAGGT